MIRNSVRRRCMRAKRIAAFAFILSLSIAGSAQPTSGAEPGRQATLPSAGQRPSAPPATPTSPDAKQPAPEPTDKQAGSEAVEQKPVAANALVLEVEGAVDWAGAGVSPLANEGWTSVRIDDRLDPGTQIRTGLRSHVNLRFGETTVVSVRSATHASIDQFYRSATSETVQVGLAYGTVRGGSTESTIHSDVRVDSTIATLAKRGTEGWEMRVEPMTGRYRISLADSGLVDAIQKLAAGRQVSKEVRPGEYATRDNIANLWINQSTFDRTVQFFEASSVTSADARFSTDNARGFAALAPGAGSQLRDLTKLTSAEFVQEQTGGRSGLFPPSTVVFLRGSVRRPEGDFGTGDTLKILLPRAGARK